ncbi:response regulator transcription factor [Paraliomyxa miuraensis]|uniref:response regulator transcription factor n=1 Tax=Paraliomyxa miuraensis TaxID=376150 RepID=UPI00225C2176|nr:response regulator [Paraliomyxa miuraensis]MCX4244318.1 response regulator [Paraliomyxa miuraensis]
MQAQASGSCVLVAEDDPNLRRLISWHLRREGHEVIEARDGNDALQLLARHALRGTHLTAIVMDVRMPGHTGLSILRNLRDAASTTPVVLITAFGDDKTHQRAAELGARAVLDKPFAMETLCRVLSDTVPTTRAQD